MTFPTRNVLKNSTNVAVTGLKIENKYVIVSGLLALECSVQVQQCGEFLHINHWWKQTNFQLFILLHVSVPTILIKAWLLPNTIVELGKMLRLINLRCCSLASLIKGAEIVTIWWGVNWLNKLIYCTNIWFNYYELMVGDFECELERMDRLYWAQTLKGLEFGPMLLVWSHVPNLIN